MCIRILFRLRAAFSHGLFTTNFRCYPFFYSTVKFLQYTQGNKEPKKRRNLESMILFFRCKHYELCSPTRVHVSQHNFIQRFQFNSREVAQVYTLQKCHNNFICKLFRKNIKHTDNQLDLSKISYLLQSYICVTQYLFDSISVEKKNSTILHDDSDVCLLDICVCVPLIRTVYFHAVHIQWFSRYLVINV